MGVYKKATAPFGKTEQWSKQCFSTNTAYHYLTRGIDIVRPATMKLSQFLSTMLKNKHFPKSSNLVQHGKVFIQATF